MMKPGSPEWKAHRAQLLTEESGKPLRWFYLSFADEHRFHGAAIVEASGEAHALEQTHKLGINPGGAVAILQVPDHALPVPEAAKNRLLSKTDIAALLGTSVKFSH